MLRYLLPLLFLITFGSAYATSKSALLNNLNLNGLTYTRMEYVPAGPPKESSGFFGDNFNAKTCKAFELLNFTSESDALIASNRLTNAYKASWTRTNSMALTYWLESDFSKGEHRYHAQFWIQKVYSSLLILENFQLGICKLK